MGSVGACDAFLDTQTWDSLKFPVARPTLSTYLPTYLSPLGRGERYHRVESGGWYVLLVARDLHHGAVVASRVISSGPQAARMTYFA